MARRPPARQALPAADLRALARLQRMLILCLMLQIGLWAGFVFVGNTDPDFFNYMKVPSVLSFLLGLFGAVCVGLIGARTTGPVLGFIFGLIAAVPCVGVAMMLSANSQANSTLKANGVRVGWFGARAEDLAGLVEDPDLDGDGGKAEVRSVYDVNPDEGW